MFRTQHKSNRQASNVTDEINPDMATPSTGLVPNSTYLASQAVNDHHRTSVKLYENLLVKGVCREQARGVLPQNLYTEYYGTCNLNNLIKFINLRTHEGAQWEIQRVATACLTIAESLWPIAVSSFRSQKKL
jgi:thymidylate synthase (FAD)